MHARRIDGTCPRSDSNAIRKLLAGSRGGTARSSLHHQSIWRHDT
jgi:hypothetical protein